MELHSQTATICSNFCKGTSGALTFTTLASELMFITLCLHRVKLKSIQVTQSC